VSSRTKQQAARLNNAAIFVSEMRKAADEAAFFVADSSLDQRQFRR
jgi:hypothetical protein